MLLTVLVACATPKDCCSQGLKKYFKFATFYAAASGGTSISDVDVFSVKNGLETSTIKTPFDYNLAFEERTADDDDLEIVQDRLNTWYMIDMNFPQQEV